MKAFGVDELIGNTPMVDIAPLAGRSDIQLLLKLEGNNLGGSVKDRPAFNMINMALHRGQIAPGERLIEATSGNTGIALALVASMKGLQMELIMPADSTQERKASMALYGAKLTLAESMEEARDLAQHKQANGEGLVLDQFNNPDNPDAHAKTTGPEIWRDTQGQVSHFFASMGTTGTITGTSRYLKGQNSHIKAYGLQPAEGARIPGIRTWPLAYVPGFFDPSVVDHKVFIAQDDAEYATKLLATTMGIGIGISGGGVVHAMLQAAATLPEHSVAVGVVPDRADRYLSTGLFG